MRKWLMVVAVAVVLAMAGGPAAANDAIDACRAVTDFVLDTIQDADGAAVGVLSGDVATATAVTLQQEWKPLPQVTLMGEIGVTTAIGGNPKSQFLGGSTISIANWKGTRLVIGVELVSRDISERKVPLLEHVGICVRYVPVIGISRSI